MKRIKILCLFLVLCFMANFAACTSASQSVSSSSESQQESTPQEDGTDSQKAAEVTVWHVWGSGEQAAAFEEALKIFEDKYPNIKIEATAFEPDAFQVQGLKTAVAANDFADVTHAWIGSQSQPFVESGKLMCLDEYLTDDVMAQLLPGALDGFTYNDKVYGLPYVAYTTIMLYNQKLFDQYDLAIPETYDDLVSVCQTFLDNDITPLCLGGKELWTTMIYYDIMAIRYMGLDSVKTALSGGAFERDDWLACTKKFSELVEIDAFGENAATLGRYEVEQEFKMGKIPMLVEGSWVLSDVYTPDNSVVKESMVLAPFPIMSDGKGKATETLGMVNDGWVMNASAAHPDEAFIVMTELMHTMSDINYSTGINAPAWVVSEDVDTSNVSPAISEVKSILENSSNSMPFWDGFLNADRTTSHKNALQALVAKTMTPEEFVDDMEAFLK